MRSSCIQESHANEYELSTDVYEVRFQSPVAQGSFAGMKRMNRNLARLLPWRIVPAGWLDPLGRGMRARLYAEGRRHTLKKGKETDNGRSWASMEATIVVVVRNAAASVLTALNSAEAAILRDARSRGSATPFAGILIIDDHSTDETPAALAVWMKGARVPVRSYRTAWHVGVTRARNLGLERAETSRLLFLDADNTIFEDGWIRYRQAAEAHADAAVIVGALRVTNRMKTMRETIGDEPFDLGVLFSEGPQRDVTGLFQVECLRKLGGFDEELLLDLWGLEDYDLWMRLGLAELEVISLSEEVGTMFRGAETHWASKTVKTLGQAQEVFERRFGPNFTAYQTADENESIA